MPASSAAFLIAFGSETGDFFSSSTALALGLATAPLVAFVASWGRFVPRAPAASSAAEATAKLTCGQMEEEINSYSVLRNELVPLSFWQGMNAVQRTVKCHCGFAESAHSGW